MPTFEQLLEQVATISHIDFNLERPFAALKAVWPNLPGRAKIVTIAGTNGKGSTAFLTNRSLQALGLKTALYTSPHLYDIKERIVINDVPISEEDATRLLSVIVEKMNALSLHLTHFEILTLVALGYFYEKQCDVWVLEVGMGGRLDAVNLLDADVSVFTTISLDHTQFLGSTLESIAAEKAGIARPGKPALVGMGAQKGSLIEKLQRQGAEVWCEKPDPNVANLRYGSFHSSHMTLACEAVERLLNKGVPFPLKQTILDKAVWPGRFQWFHSPHGTWVLDVAHNAESADRLAELLRPYCDQYPHVVAVWHSLQEKDHRFIVRALKPLIQHWIVAPMNVPRASAVATLTAVLEQENILDWQAPPEPFSIASEYATRGSLVVVFGGFHIVSEFGKKLMELHTSSSNTKAV